GWPRARQPCRLLGKALAIEEVSQIDPLLRIDALVRRQQRCRSRHMEVAERIRRPIGVAPEPVDLALVDRSDHAVGAKHLAVEDRLLDRRRFAKEKRVAVNAGAGDPVKPLGDIEAFDLQDGLAAGLYLQCLATKTETVLGKLVAMALDVEKNILIHQARLVESDAAGAVGVIADVV